jgi:electron transfer flavoprotein alpha subunit
MAEVLVLAEHAGGEVKKVTCELITLARRFGEPAVVWTGPGAEEGQPRCAEFGAARIYVASDAAFDDYVVAPTAALLAQLVKEKAPALVLVAGTPEAKEVAARLAVKTDSGLITDAVDLTSGETGDPVAEQSIFGGSTVVHSRVSRGTPIVAVRPNSVPAQAEPGPAELTPVSLAGEVDGARITGRVVAERGERPELTEASIVVSGGRGRVPRGDRRRLVPAPVPGRPDRQDRLAPAVHGDRHLRCDPAPGRHADLQDDHRR